MPDRFDGDAHPGATADYCPICGYAAQPGELSHAQPICPSCGENVAGRRRSTRPFWDVDEGANTWS